MYIHLYNLTLSYVHFHYLFCSVKENISLQHKQTRYWCRMTEHPSPRPNILITIFQNRPQEMFSLSHDHSRLHRTSETVVSAPRLGCFKVGVASHFSSQYDKTKLAHCLPLYPSIFTCSLHHVIQLQTIFTTYLLYLYSDAHPMQIQTFVKLIGYVEEDDEDSV